MKTATVADLRNRLPCVFKWIEEGEEVELTKHGRVVARIVPAPPVTPRKFKAPNFGAIRRKALGEKPAMLTAADSAVIRDRGDR